MPPDHVRNYTGWQRYVLLASARLNAGDNHGCAHALSVLLGMIADDHGRTPGTVRRIECAVSEASHVGQARRG